MMEQIPTGLEMIRSDAKRIGIYCHSISNIPDVGTIQQICNLEEIGQKVDNLFQRDSTKFHSLAVVIRSNMGIVWILHRDSGLCCYNIHITTERIRGYV